MRDGPLFFERGGRDGLGNFPSMPQKIVQPFTPSKKLWSVPNRVLMIKQGQSKTLLGYRRGRISGRGGAAPYM